MLIQDKAKLESVREKDNNGYMHVATSNLTKEQVVPYMGDTIPGYKELGLEPSKVYMIYRPAEEIEKAAQTFNGLPLMLDHWEMDADNIPKDKVVGSLGTDAKWEPPYLTNSLIVTDSKAIEAIENGSFSELSASYACDIDMTGGVFDGKSYDGIMRNIKGNHVALVHEGRAGHDVKVEDSSLFAGGDVPMGWLDKLKGALQEILTDKEALRSIMNENENKETQNPVEQAADVEPVDEVADEIREQMKAAGLDPEDKTAQKAFLAGMAVAKPVDDGCGEGEKAADETAEEKTADEDEPAPAKAQDSAMVHDRAFYSSLYEAAEKVAPFVGKIANPFAFDSAADIYKKALVKQGIVLDGIDPAAYGAMVGMLTRPAAIEQKPDNTDPLNQILMGIKTR